MLVVGAGNSGAEIALDQARQRTVGLSGRDVGQVPFRIESPLARLLVSLIFRVAFHRVLTIRTPAVSAGREMSFEAAVAEARSLALPSAEGRQAAARDLSR